MSRQLEHSVLLDAPVEKVWQVLVNFSDYSSWNSMISFKGEPAVGRKVPMRVEILGKRIVTPVNFLRMQTNKELAWMGGPKGLFTGEHYFILEEQAEGKCKLRQGEKFKGLLLPLMWPFLESTLNKLYVQTNEDIQKYLSISG